MQALISSIQATLSDLERALTLLTSEQFARPLDVFSGSSVGMHTRHIIEFYQCILQQPAHNQELTANYDKRLRDLTLQSEPTVAVAALVKIRRELSHKRSADQVITLEADCLDDESIQVASSFARELLYNLEHTIHHMALLRIGLRVLRPEIKLSDSFGVATSTLKSQAAANI